MAQKLILGFASLLLTLGVAAAADTFGGKWTISQQASNGGPPRVTVFDLKVDGTSLTGTVTAPMGGRGAGLPSPTPVAIRNGKVNGNAVTFEVVRVFADNSVTTKYEGKLTGDTLHMKQTIDVGNGAKAVELDAKRGTP
jgi:hypothetical protein